MSLRGWLFLSVLLLATVALFCFVNAYGKTVSGKKRTLQPKEKKNFFSEVMKNIKHYRTTDFWIDHSGSYRELNQKVNHLSESDEKKENA